MKRIAIIGSGPAGLYATLLLKSFDGEVCLFEQNKKLGEKLRLTGGGRMNVTNKHFSVDDFSSQENRVLSHVFKSPWIEKREEILGALGIEYKWEKNRAILKSENAFAEVDRLALAIDQQKNTQVYTEAKVLEIKKQDDQFEIMFKKEERCSSEIFDVVVLCNGGMFRIKDLGGEDEIYSLPQQLGHTITSVSPSLSPLKVGGHLLKNCAGTAFFGRFTDSQTKRIVTDDIMITHEGFSGPAVLDFTALMSSGNAELSFLPNIQKPDFEKAFKEKRNGKHRLRLWLREFLPNKLVDWHIEQLDLSVEANISDISKEKEKLLLQNLFHFPLQNLETKDYPFCWTTKGGVSLKEVNAATLESKLYKNLYFAGEVLDVNGLCGGFNISFAAISAKIVSEAVMKK